MIDKNLLIGKFTEIVGVKLDLSDQKEDGITHPDFNRWRNRYLGRQNLPNNKVELNTFHNEVDSFVCMLMNAVNHSDKG